MRLAQEAAPDESALAPVIADAWLAGGVQREQLFNKGRGPAGGFGSGEMITLLPLVFHTLSQAAPALIPLLGSGVLNAALEDADDAASADDLRRAIAVRMAVAPDEAEQLRPLAVVCQQLPWALGAQGVSEREAQSVSLKLLRTLAADAQSAQRFLHQLSED